MTMTSGKDANGFIRVYTYAFTAGKEEQYRISKGKLTSLQIKPMTAHEQGIIQGGLKEMEKMGGVRFRKARVGETVDIDFATFRESEKTSDIKKFMAFVDSSAENRRVRFSDTYMFEQIKKLTRNQPDDFLYSLLYMLELHRPDEVFSEDFIRIDHDKPLKVPSGNTPVLNDIMLPVREVQKIRDGKHWLARIPLNAQRKQTENYLISEMLKDGKSVIAFDATSLQSPSRNIHSGLSINKIKDGFWSLHFQGGDETEKVWVETTDAVTTADFEIEFWYDDSTVYLLNFAATNKNGQVPASQWRGYFWNDAEKDWTLIPQELATPLPPTVTPDGAAPELSSGSSTNDQYTSNTGSRPDMGDWPKDRPGKNGSRPGAGDNAGPEWNYGSLPEECVASITGVTEIGYVDSWALFEAVTSFNHNVAPSAPNTGDIITVGPWYSPSPIIGRY